MSYGETTSVGFESYVLAEEEAVQRFDASVKCKCSMRPGKENYKLKQGYDSNE